MHKAVSLFTLVAAVIASVWWWLGRVVPMPASPLDPGEKLYCVSYAPFQGSQTPLDLSTHIEPRQIDTDLALLAKLTDCIRIYSVDFGLDRVPEIAERHGLSVLLGLWVSGHSDRTKYQLDTGIALAKKHPAVLRGIIVGNEALLRGEIAPTALADLIRTVKRQVSVPVSYADVWEFWLRHRELAAAVDFVTVHILPYWEDHPIAAEYAADHVDSIRKRMVTEFAGKEVMIGEVGWPSAGRMRAAALPSPANQARVLHDILQRGRRENFRVNVIEAFDQPWKRYQEGTVGGHWGLFTDVPRVRKFVWGAPVSNHPYWLWQAAGGIAFAGLIFAVARLAQRWAVTATKPAFVRGVGIAATGAVSGILVGWTIEYVFLESFSLGGWLHSVAWACVAIAAPLACASALSLNIPIPPFAAVIGPNVRRERGSLARLLALLLIILTVLAMQSGLALAFDPRYRDFPFAPLTSAAVPFLLVAFLVPRSPGVHLIAEMVAATILVLSAVAIMVIEGGANWQAIWLCAALMAVAITLIRARRVPN